jgi:hypothetical protein
MRHYLGLARKPPWAVLIGSGEEWVTGLSLFVNGSIERGLKRTLREPRVTESPGHGFVEQVSVNQPMR